MECFENHIWNNATKESLSNLSLDMPDKTIYKKILKNWDMVAKPLDSMGRFEKITARIGSILSTEELDISKKAVLIMCADNGIVEEGISQSSEEVTTAVVREIARGASSVGKMAKFIGAEIIVVDIGIKEEISIPKVVKRKIRCGTRNFRIEPAMTEEEVVKAIFTGIELVSDCKQKGYHILATGEMGIGNTTTSSAVTAALLKCEVDSVTGRGAGLSDEKLLKKQKVIKQAIEMYQLYQAEPFQILQIIGGLDIAGLTGICIGGAMFHIPIVLDGVISMTAALLAERIVPGTVEFLIPSHKGKEPAVEKLIKELGWLPVIDAELALGEGTGAVMMLSLLDLALCIYKEKTTFSDIQIEQYKRWEI